MTDLLDQIDAQVAESARQTIAMMRISHFDLLLAGRKIPDAPVWSLIGRIRSSWPEQRWVLIAEDITSAEEIQARSLGALMVIDRSIENDCLDQLAVSLRRRRTEAAERSINPTMSGIEQLVRR
ncbi:MAG TPA: hypothetical protein VHD56_19485 [Tepidisphaeraceae bacterium]|nr:hypothetical protein [Tepidisphaeraceae bacterium]